ncbi:hypothetical protein [Ureaplasma urealyticum]|uniref:hypothetical protein n=1 Tax=Ureaplasma urealyticum TaxID=2130 RepID=UPI001F60D7DF|nr:hypothetical protein [Ureaplasma urealyticum]
MTKDDLFFASILKDAKFITDLEIPLIKREEKCDLNNIVSFNSKIKDLHNLENLFFHFYDVNLKFEDYLKLFLYKQFKDLIMERKIIGKCPWNYWDRDLVWEKLVKLICASEASFSVFIEYMKTKMTACEYSTLKEISDDIVAIFPWISFIKEYRF